MIEIAAAADALYARLAAGAFDGLPIAMPEPAIPFTTPADGKYLRASILANAPRWNGIGRQSVDQGLFQVDVVWPRNASELPAMRMAKRVIAHFYAQPRLFSGGVKVTIMAGAYQSPPLTEAERLTVPVSVPFTTV